LIYVKLFNKAGVQQASLDTILCQDGLWWQSLRNGGCGSASFQIYSVYEANAELSAAYNVEFWDDVPTPDVLVYSGKITKPIRTMGEYNDERKEITCFGWAQELDEQLVSIIAKGVTVKQAIELLFAQFPPPNVVFSAANVAAMDNVLLGDGYSADNIPLSQALTDLCNMQTDGTNQPYCWSVGADKVFHTAAFPAATTKEYNLNSSVGVDGKVSDKGGHNVTENSEAMRNQIIAIGGNKANGQPVKAIVQDLTSISTYGTRYAATNVTGTADNGAGLIRITSVAHGLDSSNVAEIANVGGTVEANGVWPVAAIDVDTFDLVGSTFVNAWTSGGTCARVSTIQGTITNTRIKDQAALETWALGQLQRLAYPVLTGSVEVAVPGDTSLTGQDYVRISGFTGSPAYHDYHPVSVLTRMDGYNKITTSIQLANFAPDLQDIFRQSALKAEALAGDTAPKFRVPMQASGVVLNGGEIGSVTGGAPGFYQANPPGDTDGFFSDQTINFAQSWTIDFALGIRAGTYHAGGGGYYLSNSKLKIGLTEYASPDTVLVGASISDPVAGWLSVDPADILSVGDEKRVRVGFDYVTKKLYIAFDGVEKASAIQGAGSSAAGDYTLNFGNGGADPLRDWIGDFKIEMAYRTAAEIMNPSIFFKCAEGAGIKIYDMYGNYTATLTSGTAASITWRAGLLKQALTAATIKTITGAKVDIVGSDLTLTDNRMNFVFAGSDGAWHADTTNTYLDTDANAILCYKVIVVNGAVKGTDDMRPMGAGIGTKAYDLVQLESDDTLPVLDGSLLTNLPGVHTQNTDTGTTEQTYQLQSGSSGVRIKNNAGVLEARNAADGAYAVAKVKDLVADGVMELLESSTTPGTVASYGQVYSFSGAGDIDSYCKTSPHLISDLIDSALSPHAYTARGGAAINSGSLLLNGSTDWIDTPDSDDWFLSTGPFTIGGLGWLDALPANGVMMGLCGQSDGVITSYYFGVYNNAGTYQLEFGIYESGQTLMIRKDIPGTPSLGQLYHLEVTKDGSNDYRLFWEGTQCGTTVNDSNDIPNIAGVFCIGCAGIGWSYWQGRIKEFYFDKGIARHTANFTAPPAARTVALRDLFFIDGAGVMRRTAWKTSNLDVFFNEGNVGIGTTTPTSALQVVGIPIYANNAAALAGGLTAGAFYRTNADPDFVAVVH
jgi:hypothetical protein